MLNDLLMNTIDSTHDTLLGYLWLKPEVTGIDVDIFVDDGGAFLRDGHVPIAFVRNGHGREVEEFIAFALEGEQEILSTDIDIRLSGAEIIAAKHFIRENQALLIDFAKEKLDISEFVGKVIAFHDQLLTDADGGVYTPDGKRLLRCPDVKRYRIREGCEEADSRAFDRCEQLESLYVPYTFTEEAFEQLMDYATGDALGNVCLLDRPYVEEVLDVNAYWCDEEKTTTDEYGVVYANEGRRLLRASKPGLIGSDYRVPDGVLTICDDAFAFRDYAFRSRGEETPYLVLSVPRSIKVIGDSIFGCAGNGGRIEIRD